MANEFVSDVGDADFQKVVVESPKPVLVDFWASWCGPCKAIAPVVEELAKAYQGKLKVAKLNVDEHQATAQKFGIRSIPTLLLFEGGKVVNQVIGAVPKAKIDEAIQQVLRRQTTVA